MRAERWDQQGEGVRPGRQQKGEMGSLWTVLRCSDLGFEKIALAA